MANRAALIRAENAGLPITGRGRNSITFDLGNGQRKAVLTIEPLHVRNSETEIDATWLPDSGAWQWKIGDNDWQAHARDVFNVGSLVEWRHSSGEWVVVDPQSINWTNQDNSRQQIAIKQPVTGIANDATLSFPDAYGAGRHFSYMAHPKRLIKHLTLDSAAALPAPTVTGTIHLELEWTITNSSGVELYLDGVQWARTNSVRVRTANRIEFRSLATGEALWYADAPTAQDANGEKVAAEYEVMRSGGVYFIRVRVPREWLLSAAYPVVVDPTFTDGVGGDVTTAQDCFLASWIPNSNCGASASIRLSAGLLRFDASSIDGGATCDSANLYLYKTYGDSTETHNAYSVAEANKEWVEGTKDEGAADAGESTWNYKTYATVAWAGSTGAQTSGTDYEATSLGSWQVGAADAVGTEYNISLTAARIEGWFGGTNTNYGLLLGPNSGHNVASSDHATTGYRPKLVLVYTAGGTPQELAAVAAGAGTEAAALRVERRMAGIATGASSMAASLTVASAPTLTAQQVGAAIHLDWAA